MAAIGSTWGTGTWSDDIWAVGTWGDAIEAVVTPPETGGGGGGAGGAGIGRGRPDFGWRGNRLDDDEPKRRRSPIDEAARQTADAILEKARQIAGEKAAIESLKQSKMREKRAAERAAKVAAMEARVASMESEMDILRDDEEVLRILRMMI